MSTYSDLKLAYQLRLKRRRLLWRSLRARHQIKPLQNRTDRIAASDIIVFSTMRNEALRLPYWLEYYRALGVRHFLIVDNDSTDGTTDLLQQQPDVSLWTTGHAYRESRFGVDWLTWLQMRYGHRHWSLTVDADEILTYPHIDRCDLPDLTGWLDKQGIVSFGALMLDMYPQGPLGDAKYNAGDDPTKTLSWFDPDGYSRDYLPKYQLTSIRGGPRKRLFFHGQTEDHAPHLHKFPLIRWNRRFAYVSSTHHALPRRLNTALDTELAQPTGALLHTKFLDNIIEKSAEEKQRQQHFTHTERYSDYYDRLIERPTLWHEKSAKYQGWQQLCDLKIMQAGRWTP